MQRDEVGLLKQLVEPYQPQARLFDKGGCDRRRISSEHSHPECPCAADNGFADVPDANNPQRAFPERQAVRFCPQAAADVLIHPWKTAREAEDVSKRGISHG